MYSNKNGYREQVKVMNGGMDALFDPNMRAERQRPDMPTTEGIEYPRASSWAILKLAKLLDDNLGRQLFHVFLFDSLAEENLNFHDAVESMRKLKGSERSAFAKEIIEKYMATINLSAPSAIKIKESAASGDVELTDWQPALKEVKRLLENDQLPRFRRSDTYLKYLESIMPRSYAEKWATSFEALLGNHVGRYHFRLFLRSIRAEENLRFWDAVVEFRSTRNKSQSMQNQAMDIVGTFLTEGSANEVFLPFGVKQLIDKRMAENEVDIGLFDEATKHVEQVLRNDPYVRFLQSSEYLGLLEKLKEG